MCGVLVVDATVADADDGEVIDRVTIVVFDGFQPLDAIGPHEVFAGAGRYRTRIASVCGGPVRSESGLEVVTIPLPRRIDERDLVLVAGGNGVYGACDDEDALVRWLRRMAPRAGRIASVCTGAFLLAQAGLLDGRRVATHWYRAERLAARFPGVVVDTEALYLRDGDVWTSAGVTAGVDLALAMVEHDHSAELAQVIARHLVMYLRRPGGQSQYAAPVFTAPATHDVVRTAVDRIEADLTAPHSLDSLASAVGISSRHLARLFRQQLGDSPTRYLERRRVELARTTIDNEPTTTVDAVARRCGFGSTETLRRAFTKHVGVPPDAYRHRFSLTT
jgi:transcriptional regulator GlxA family with amidase domain